MNSTETVDDPALCLNPMASLVGLARNPARTDLNVGDMLYSLDKGHLKEAGKYHTPQSFVRRNDQVQRVLMGI